jgi:hypothetical protein
MSADLFPASWGMQQSPDDPAKWRGAWHGGMGYDWMAEALPRPWRPVPSWGASGWDLGDWPLVCVAHYRDSAGRLAVVQYIEGDLLARVCDDPAELDRATDAIARECWERDPEAGPPDLDAPEARGAYSRERAA